MTGARVRSGGALGCVVFLVIVLASASVAVAQIVGATKGNAALTDLVVDRFAYLVLANLAGYLALAGVVWNTGRRRVEKIVAPLVEGKLTNLKLQLSRIEGLCREMSREVEASAVERKRVADAVEKLQLDFRGIERRHIAEDVLNGGPPIGEDPTP